MKADLVFLFFMVAAIIAAGAAVHGRGNKRPPTF
jgi:hypothetical protein